MSSQSTNLGMRSWGRSWIVSLADYPCRAELDLEFRLLKHARQTNRVPQTTPPLRSWGRLHLTQSSNGK